MKLRNLIFSVCVLFAGSASLVSCDKIVDSAKQRLTVNVNATSADVKFTIPQVDTSGPVNFASQDVYLNVDSIIRADNPDLSVNNIRSAKLESFVLYLDSASDGRNDFGVVQNFEAKLSSENMPQMNTIASITNNPDMHSDSLVVPVTDIELKGYFQSKYFTYSIGGVTRRGTTKPLNVHAKIRYHLEVGSEQ